MTPWRFNQSRVGWSLAIFAGLLATIGLIDQFRIPTASRQLDAERLLAEAEFAMEREQWDVAIELLEECVRLDSNRVLANLYYGQLLRDRGETDRAVAIWASVREGSAVELATARFLEGSVAIERGFVDQCQELLEEAIHLNPEYLAAREKLVLVYRMLRRPDRLVEQLDRIRSQRPLTSQELILRTTPGAAGYPARDSLAVLESTQQRNPGHVDSCVALASVLLELGEERQVLELIQPVRPAETRDEDLAAYEILAHIELGEQAEARVLCAAMDERNARSDTLIHACGRAAYEDQDWRRAADLFEQVLATNPGDRENCYLLGLALQRLGFEEDAARCLRRSVKLDDIQRLCLRLTRGDINDEERLRPAYVQIARDLYDVGRLSESAEWYLRASQISPKDVELLTRFQAVRREAAQSPRDSEFRISWSIGKDNRFSKSRPGLPQRADEPTESHARPVNFVDVHESAGIDWTYFNGATGFHHLIESMGGGVIAVDYDADGWLDLYLPQGCNLPYESAAETHTDRLYRNLNGLRFVDVSGKAVETLNRYGLGGTAGDFNNDGFDDVFVSNFGHNGFLCNNGDGTCSEVADRVGINPNEMTTSAAAADFNGDGFLDLYAVNYVDGLRVCPQPDGGYLPCDPANFQGQPDRLYLNDGSGSFLDVSSAAGIDLPNGKGLGVVCADFDFDGRLDIYVANDGVPNFLFHNTSVPADAIPTFEERGLLSGTALDEQGRSQAGMGIAVGDFNQDTRPDLYVTNFYLEHNTLYTNRGELTFDDTTRRAQLLEATLDKLGFGTQAADFNGDGLDDLVVANGHILHDKTGGQPWKMNAQLFVNIGGGTFRDATKTAGDYFGQLTLGRGVAVFDWNRDGRTDIVVVSQDRPAALLENRTETVGGTISLRLIGDKSNRNAIGAVARLTWRDGVTTETWSSDGGFLACNGRDRLVTLQAGDLPESIEIQWPSGESTIHWFETNESVPTIYGLSHELSFSHVLLESGRSIAIP